jgi:hypothetical protein
MSPRSIMYLKQHNVVFHEEVALCCYYYYYFVKTQEKEINQGSPNNEMSMHAYGICSHVGNLINCLFACKLSDSFNLNRTSMLYAICWAGLVWWVSISRLQSSPPYRNKKGDRRRFVGCFRFNCLQLQMVVGNACTRTDYREEGGQQMNHPCLLDAS